MAVNIGPGDEVIIPSFGFVAFANAVVYTGATPVLVDVNANTWCLDFDELLNSITPKTKVVILVHNYGVISKLIEIAAHCKRSGIIVIWDSAEALGSSSFGIRAGSVGDLGTFSFYGNKVITCGEGGAVVTNDPILYERVKFFRMQARDPKIRYYFPEIGFNYRLLNLSTAV